MCENESEISRELSVTMNFQLGSLVKLHHKHIDYSELIHSWQTVVRHEPHVKKRFSLRK